VGKHDLEAKLKARLGEWEAYGDQPMAPLAQTADHIRQSSGGRSGDEDAEAGILAPIDGAGYGASYGGSRVEAETPRIAELLAEIERERHQSRRLLELAAREQVLHAATHRAQQQAAREAPIVQRPAVLRSDLPREAYHVSPRRSGTGVVLTILLMLMCGVIYGVVYLLIH
jgi:hypothetical protein